MAKKKGHGTAVRLSAEASRQRILEATLRLLGKHGWIGTSFQMIADACGISQSNVLYHFNTREDLLRGLLGKITANNYQIVSVSMRPDFDAFQRISMHLRKNLEWAQNYPDEAQVIMLVYYDATHDHQFGLLFREILDRAQNRILEYVLAGMREKIFYPELPPPVLAAVIHNMLVGAFINLMAGRKTGVKDYKEKEWSQIISALVGYRKSRDGSHGRESK